MFRHIRQSVVPSRRRVQVVHSPVALLFLLNIAAPALPYAHADANVAIVFGFSGPYTAIPAMHALANAEPFIVLQCYLPAEDRKYKIIRLQCAAAIVQSHGCFRWKRKESQFALCLSQVPLARF